jgi:hypothetical protein
MEWERGNGRGKEGEMGATSVINLYHTLIYALYYEYMYIVYICIYVYYLSNRTQTLRRNEGRGEERGGGRGSKWKWIGLRNEWEH